MKRILHITLLLIGYATTTQAQTFLSNGSFETWEDKGGYSEPQYWYTLNSLSMFGLEPSTIVSETQRTGQKAVLLFTVENSIQNIPGILSTGPILNEDGDVDTVNNLLVPFVYRPKSMSFYYKYIPGPMDSCNAYMALTKWNSTTQQTDTIAEASFSVKDTVAEYARAEVDFVYYSNQMPDSAMVIISSSFDGFNPVVGSALYVDDFAINFNTGLNNTLASTIDVNVFPNPATDNIQIQTKETQVDLELFNAIGQLVWSEQNHQTNKEISLAGLPVGVYSIKVTSLNGVAIHKISKQ